MRNYPTDNVASGDPQVFLHARDERVDLRAPRHEHNKTFGKPLSTEIVELARILVERSNSLSDKSDMAVMSGH